MQNTTLHFKYRHFRLKISYEKPSCLVEHYSVVGSEQFITLYGRTWFQRKNEVKSHKLKNRKI